MMQRYKSQKEVWAGKIQGVHMAGDGDRVAERVTRIQVGGRQYEVPADFSARGTPEIGDWLVQYDDGYISWSPAKAFEEGYTLVEERQMGVGGAAMDPLAQSEHAGTQVVRPCDTEDDDVQQDGSVDAGALESHG